jgi:hypothetical protein
VKHEWGKGEEEVVVAYFEVIQHFVKEWREMTKILWQDILYLDGNLNTKLDCHSLCSCSVLASELSLA